MNILLSKPNLKTYMQDITNFKSILRKEEIEETKKIQRVIKRTKIRNQREKYLNEYLKPMTQTVFTRKELNRGVEELETDETFKINKNDPNKYPELKKVESKAETVDDGMEAIRKDLHKRFQMKAVGKLKPVVKNDPLEGMLEDEGYDVHEEQSLSAFVVKKKGKKQKKRGKKKKRKAVGSFGME